LAPNLRDVARWPQQLSLVSLRLLIAPGPLGALCENLPFCFAALSFSGSAFAYKDALCAAMRPKCGTSVSKYRDVAPGFVERSNILFCLSLSYAQMMCAD
jgi:hypothetical protein